MGMAATSVNNSGEYSGDLNIKANVVQLLKFTEKQALDFGDIVLGESADSITAGQMQVKGQPNYTVTVTVPATATISKDGADLTTVTLDSHMSGLAQTLDDNGELIQVVTGKIAEGATKNTGIHTGTVSISARYN